MTPTTADRRATARSSAVLAPAKVNLTLSVRGRRPDGLHELESVFLRTGLADELIAGIAEGPDDRVTVIGDPRCPADDNIVLRAAALLRNGRPGLPALSFELRKRIPLAAGLGGGSSDGAAALRACEALWDLGLDPAERHDLAVRLGSDVPFFASGAAAALVTGRGDELEPLPAPSGPLGLLIVTGGEKSGTGAVFAQHDRLVANDGTGHAAPSGVEDGERSATATRWLAAALRDGLVGRDLAGQASLLRDANDLWPAAARLIPGLARLRDELEGTLGRPVFLSGAGPSLVSLYPSVEEAADAARRIAAEPAGDALATGPTTIMAIDLTSPTPAWRSP